MTRDTAVALINQKANQSRKALDEMRLTAAERDTVEQAVNNILNGVNEVLNDVLPPKKNLKDHKKPTPKKKGKK